MDSLPGPIPYLHEFFSSAKGPLQDDFPFPGTTKVSTDNQLVHADNDAKKFGALSFEYENASNETNVSATVKLRCPWDKNFYGGWQVSSDKGFNPIAQFACPTCPHSLTLDRSKVVYHYAHSTFAIRAKSNFWEGVPVNASCVAYLGSNYYLGALVDYDALRSGLRKSLVVLNHGFNTNNDATVSINGRREIGFAWKKVIAEKSTLLLDVLPSEDIAVIGFQQRINDNASLLLRGDVFARNVAAAVNFVLSGWNVGVSVTVDENDVRAKSYTPKVGFSFSA